MDHSRGADDDVLSAKIGRFAADVAALVENESRPIGFAVSGGPDSMALLALAAAAFPDAVQVATVDHGLRPANADEAAMVADHCRAIGVPHATLHPAAPIAGASLQAQARAARYAALAAWAAREGLAAVATAHHADDQAETLLMRLARGSGIAGTAAIRPRATIAGLTVVRPLLGWRRAELRAIVEARDMPFIDDPANADPRHDRTRFRALLAGNGWIDPAALARSAAALGEANDDLATLADLLWEARVTTAGEVVTIDVAGLPRDTRRRLARRAVRVVRSAAAIAAPAFDDSSNVEPLLDALAGGGAATHAGVHAVASGDRWRFVPAPPRRSH